MREIFIERREKLLRIAIKDKNVLERCFIEEETGEPLPGEIYKGVVKNIVPAIKSIFVEIGYDKQAFLTMSNDTKGLKKGDEIMVEVLKEGVGNKGAKVTTPPSIPGRWAVISPNSKGISISKRFDNSELAAEITDKLRVREDMGVTIRTNAQEVSLAHIEEEYLKLLKIYDDIKREHSHSLRPKKLYGENALLHKVLRDNLNEDTKSIYVDSEDDFNLVKEYVKDCKVELYNETRTLFDYYGLEKEILALRHNKVSLKCGGYIVIDKTEAMYVVDVNSSKNTNGYNMDKTIEETNLEAAQEIGRQIKLRNLSGIIVIDFIDMHKKDSKEKVFDVLRKSLEDDKNMTKIYPFTELNLIQISRGRSGKSICEYMEESCINCKGSGKRLKTSYLNILIRNDVIRLSGEGSLEDFYIEINTEYQEDIRGNIFGFLADIDSLDKNIYLKFVDEIECFRVSPLLFKNQIENVKEYKISFD